MVRSGVREFFPQPFTVTLWGAYGGGMGWELIALPKVMHDRSGQGRWRKGEGQLEPGSWAIKHGLGQTMSF